MKNKGLLIGVLLFLSIVIFIFVFYYGKNINKGNKTLSCISDGFSYKSFVVIVDKDNKVQKVTYYTKFTNKDKNSYEESCKYMKENTDENINKKYDYVKNTITCNDKTLDVELTKEYKVDGDNKRTYAYQVKKYTNDNSVLDLEKYKAYFEKNKYKCDF